MLNIDDSNAKFQIPVLPFLTQVHFLLYPLILSSFSAPQVTRFLNQANHTLASLLAVEEIGARYRRS
jgi:hypothetical protein